MPQTLNFIMFPEKTKNATEAQFLNPKQCRKEGRQPPRALERIELPGKEASGTKL